MLEFITNNIIEIGTFIISLCAAIIAYNSNKNSTELQKVNNELKKEQTKIQDELNQVLNKQTELQQETVNIKKEQQVLNKENNRLTAGVNEMEIRNMITGARQRFEDLSIQVATDKNNKILNQIMNSALESLLNAYDEACAKYNDGKTDKERFKKTYHEEIRKIVTNEATRGSYDRIDSNYQSTLKVYDEWFNLEK